MSTWRWVGWYRRGQHEVAAGEAVDDAQGEAVGRLLRLPGRFAQAGVGGGIVSGGEGVARGQHRLINRSDLLAEHAFGQQRIDAGEQPVDLAAEVVQVRRRL